MKNTIFSVALLISLRWASTQQETQQSCDSRIYCQGPVLDYVQKAKIFPDSKTFVDMKLTYSVNKTLKDFDKLLKLSDNHPTKEQIKEFVNVHFSTVNEFENWSLPDYKSNPKFLDQIQDQVVRDFAKNLVSIWPDLARKVKQEVAENPEHYSLIPLPNGFVIPGGRFKETYYWDSYWIIKGLLISEMPDTARGMLDNFIELIKRYGFIPNGSRVYYLNRSQPPLFTYMAASYVNATNDVIWLKKNIDLIEKELQFWLENKTVNVTKDNVTYTLAHYNSESATPRPESYSEDIQTASFYDDESQKMYLYTQLKSGAETGWDFSSRWIFDESGGTKSNLSRTETSRVIPVDLNAYLCGNFKLLQEFYDKLGVTENAKYWMNKHNQWQAAIQNVLYNEKDGIWYDYDVKLNKSRIGFYPSNLAPLWAKAVDPSKSVLLGNRAADYLVSLKINEFPGGAPTSLEYTGEQWDFPNAWPPLQSLIVFGLENSGSEKARDLAKAFAVKFLNSNIKGFRDNQDMYEKYDAVLPGQRGGGGEYNVQTGFGWSNGVALEFIDYYYRQR